MNPFAVSGIAIMITSAISGIVIYLFSADRRASKILSILHIFIFNWGLSSFKIAMASTAESGLLWWRIGYFSVIWMPVVFFQFICVFLRIKRPLVLAVSYVYAVLCTLAVIYADARFFIGKVELVFGQFYWNRNPQPLHVGFFVLIFFGLVLYCVVLMFKGMAHADPERRAQIKYYLLGSGIAWIGGELHFLLTFSIADVYPYFNFLLPLYPLIMGYAILRHQLLDIKVIIKRTLIFAGLFALVYGAFAFFVVAGQDAVARLISECMSGGINFTKWASFKSVDLKAIISQFGVNGTRSILNPFTVSALLTAVLCYAIGVITFLKGQNARLNNIWLGVAFGSGSWGLFSFFASISRDANASLFFWQLSYVGVIFVPICFLHFVSVFLGQCRPAMLRWLYGLGALFLCISWFLPSHFFGGIRVVFGNLNWFGPPGWMFVAFYLLFYIGITLYSYLVLFKGYFSSEGLRKQQLLIFIIGSSIGWLGSEGCFPISWNAHFYPITNYLIAIYPIILAYGILRHRLFDISIIVKRTLIFTGLFTLVYGAFSFFVVAGQGVIERILAGQGVQILFDVRQWFQGRMGNAISLPSLIFLKDSYGTMNLYSFSCIAVLASSIAMGVFVFVKSKDKRIRFVWTLFSFAVVLWGVGSFLASIAKAYDVAKFWWQFGYQGVIFTVVFFTHFVFCYLRRPKNIVLIYAYFGAIIFSFFLWVDGSKFFINHMTFAFGQLYWVDWAFYKPIVWLIFYAGFYSGLLLYSFALLIIRYRQAGAANRNQLKYLILSMFIGWLGTHGEFLLCFGIKLYPASNFLIALYTVIFAYSIIRYQLLDINVVIKRTLIFAGLFALVYGVFALAVVAGQEMMQKVFAGAVNFTSIWNFYTRLMHSFQMMPLSWLSLVTLVFLAAITIFVLARNPRSRVARLYAFYCISVFVWCLGAFFAYTITDRAFMLNAARLMVSGGLFVPLLAYHFSSEIGKSPRDLAMMPICYGITGVLLVMTVVTDKVVIGFYQYAWGPYLKLSAFAGIGAVLYYVFSIRAIWILHAAIRRAMTNLMQLRYVYVAMLISMISGADYLPTFGVPMYPPALFLTIIMVTTVAIAIVKQRLFDISVIIKRTLIFGGLFALVYGVFAFFVVAGQEMVWSRIMTMVNTLSSRHGSSITNYPALRLIWIGSSLAVGIVCVSLMGLLIRYGKQKIHRIWAIFNLLVGIWAFGAFFIGLADTPERALLAWKVAIIGALFSPALFYHVFITLGELRRRMLLKFFYGFSVVFYLLCVFNLAGVKIVSFQSIYFIQASDYRYAALVFIWMVIIFFAEFETIRVYLSSTDYRRLQYSYLVAGFITGFTGAIVIVLPMLKIVSLPWLSMSGNLFIGVYCVLVPYAILRHHLLDIKIIIKRTLIFGGLFALVYGVFAFFVAAGQEMMQKVLAGQALFNLPPMTSFAPFNALAISGLVIGITCTVLTFLVLRYSTSKVQHSFGLQNMTMPIWGFGMFLAGAFQDPVWAAFWWKVAIAGGLCIIPLLLNHMLVLNQISRKWLVYSAWVWALSFIPVCFFGFDHTTVAYDPRHFYVPTAPNLPSLFYYWVWLLGAGSVSLLVLRAFRLTPVHQRRAMLIYALAYIFGLWGGGFYIFYVALGMHTNIYPYTNYCIALYCIGQTYAIFKHRLFDIAVIIKRTLIFAGMLTLCYVVLSVGVIFVQTFIEAYIVGRGRGLSAFTISSIVMTVTTFSMSMFLFFVKSKEPRVIRLWGLFCLSVSVWGVSSFRFSMAHQYADAYFWVQAAHICIYTAPAIYTRFTFELLGIRKPRIMAALYSYSVFNLVGVFVCPALFMPSVEYVRSGFYFFFWSKDVSLFYLAHYMIGWLLVVPYNYYLLIKYAYFQKGEKQTYVKSFIFLSCFGWGGAELMYLFAFHVNIDPTIGNYMTAFFPLITTYAILRKQLFDIDVIIKKTVVFTGLFLSVYVIFAMFAMLGQVLFERLVTANRWLSMIPSVIAVTVLLRPLENFLVTSTDRYLFQKKYDYKELVKEFTQEVLSVFELERLLHLTAEKLAQIIKLESCRVYLVDEEGGRFVCRGDAGAGGISQAAPPASLRGANCVLSGDAAIPQSDANDPRKRKGADSSFPQSNDTNCEIASSDERVQNRPRNDDGECGPLPVTVGRMFDGGREYVMREDVRSGADNVGVGEGSQAAPQVSLRGANCAPSGDAAIPQSDAIDPRKRKGADSSFPQLNDADCEIATSENRVQYPPRNDDGGDIGCGGIDPFAATGAELIIPIRVRGAVVGFVALGKKLSDRMYTQDDLSVLVPLGRTLAIAVANARLFAELGAAQRDSAQKERMAVVGTLAAGMAHEIRNPVTTIKIFSQYLPDKISEEEFVNKYKTIVTKEVDRIDHVIQTLIDFSGEAPPGVGNAVDVGEVFDELVMLFGASPECVGRIEIRANVPDDLPPVRVSREDFDEILINIVQNAIHAIKADGRIILEAACVGEGVEIVVRDTGCGMSGEVAAQIFSPFFTTKATGFGLGLFVVNELIRRNGGTVNVESRPGEGTTFRLSFAAAR